MIMAMCATAVGCTYNELPPKTGDATSTYTLPKGTLPSADEKAVMQAARTEYEEYLKNNLE